MDFIAMVNSVTVRSSKQVYIKFREQIKGNCSSTELFAFSFDIATNLVAFQDNTLLLISPGK